MAYFSTQLEIDKLFQKKGKEKSKQRFESSKIEITLATFDYDSAPNITLFDVEKSSQLDRNFSTLITKVHSITDS